MLSDYVTERLGRDRALPAALSRQADRTQREVITYRGHTNNHISVRYVDTARGRSSSADDGTLAPALRARPPRELFAEVHAAGGFTQINHPTIFPSSTPFRLRLPRVSVGLHRRRDRLFEGRRHRDPDRARRGGGPVHAHRHRVLGAALDTGARSRRSGERLTQRRPHAALARRPRPGDPVVYAESCPRPAPPWRPVTHLRQADVGKGPDLRLTGRGARKKKVTRA